MEVFAVIAIWLVLLGIAIFAWRRAVAHERARERLAGVASQENSDATRPPVPRARRLTRRSMWVPWIISIAIGLSIWFLLEWPIQYILAISLVLALLLSQLEGYLATRREARLETQLADSLDIMVGALGAGAGVGPAIEAAIIETGPPLRPYLQEVAGRIRLGDDPVEVFRSLAERVPLETFLLFASALSVHWEVGGRLAPTLATVGRTIRDRIEVTRRIRSNIAQSQFSTFAIIGLTYLIAVIVWRNGPEPMYEFVTSRVGSWFVAGSIILQAVGIVWMNMISKPKF